jgi:type VI secretion system protein ImpG
MMLSLVDLDFNPAQQANWTVSVDTTCLNRDLPERLPYGGGRLQLAGGAAAVERVTFLTAPTPTLRPRYGRHGHWRLISHLTLNHLSLTDAGDGADALREILKLYDFRDSEETRALINGVLSVSSRRGAARVSSEGRAAVCRGMEVTVQFDPAPFSGSGLYLMAAVLERFLALYCSINAFTRLTATVKGRQGVLCTWQPRAGDRVLL